MDPILFADQVPDHFLCSICLCVVVDPVEHIDCDKVFCKGCLAALHQQNCPNCRGSLQNKTKKMNRVLHDMYEKLAMRCVNEGCVDTFPWTQQSKHEATCAFIPKVACEHCGEQTLPKAKEEHYKICALWPVVCTVPGCGQIVPRSLMCDHNRDNADQHLQTLMSKVQDLQQINLEGKCRYLKLQKVTSRQEKQLQEFRERDRDRERERDPIDSLSSSLEEAFENQVDSKAIHFHPIVTLDQHTAAVFSLLVSHHENRLYTGSRDKTIKLWDLETWDCLGTWEGHTDTVTCFAFSTKLFRLFSGCGDHTIKVWDTLTNTASSSPGRCLQTWTSHRDIVTFLVLHEETDRLYSSSFDKTIQCWNILDGTCVGTMCGHTDRVRSIVLGKSNSPSAGCLYSGSDDKTIKAWNLENHSCIHTFSGINTFVYAVTLSGDGTRLYGGTHTGTIRVWDTAFPYGCMKVIQGHQQFVMSLVVSSQDQLLFSGSGDGTIKVWDMSDNDHTCLTTIQAHTDNIRCITLSEHFRTLFSGSIDKLVQVYGLEA